MTRDDTSRYVICQGFTRWFTRRWSRCDSRSARDEARGAGGGHELVQPRGFGFGYFATECCERVSSSLARAFVGRRPAADLDDQSVRKQALDDAVQRPRTELRAAIRTFGHVLHDAVSVF